MMRAKKRSPVFDERVMEVYVDERMTDTFVSINKMEIDLKLERVDCPSCGMIMMLPKNLIDMKRGDHETFQCAAGHKMNFRKPDNNDPVILRKRIAELEAEVKQLKQEKVQLLHKMEQAGV
jgi:hypothetical protein